MSDQEMRRAVLRKLLEDEIDKILIEREKKSRLRQRSWWIRLGAVFGSGMALTGTFVSYHGAVSEFVNTWLPRLMATVGSWLGV